MIKKENKKNWCWGGIILIGISFFIGACSKSGDEKATQQAKDKGKSPQPKVIKAKYSYALGQVNGEGLKARDIPIDIEAYLLGVYEGVNKKASRLADEERLLAQKELEKVEEQKHRQVAQRYLKEGKTFLAKNKKRKEIQITASGLQYRVLQKGKGKLPTDSDDVKISYTATFTDGTEVDFSFNMPHPIIVTLAGGLMPGLTEGLLMMKPGGIREFFIPSELAYGEDGTSGIPGNAVLIVKVELIEILPPRK